MNPGKISCSGRGNVSMLTSHKNNADLAYNVLRRIYMYFTWHMQLHTLCWYFCSGHVVRWGTASPVCMGGRGGQGGWRPLEGHTSRGEQNHGAVRFILYFKAKTKELFSYNSHWCSLFLLYPHDFTSKEGLLRNSNGWLKLSITDNILKVYNRKAADDIKR